MPLKRRTPVGHGGLFAVFILPLSLPCAGEYSLGGYFPRAALRAHTAAHRGKQGAVSPSL